MDREWWICYDIWPGPDADTFWSDEIADMIFGYYKGFGKKTEPKTSDHATGMAIDLSIMDEARVVALSEAANTLAANMGVSVNEAMLQVGKAARGLADLGEKLNQINQPKPPKNGPRSSRQFDHHGRRRW